MTFLKYSNSYVVTLKHTLLSLNHVRVELFKQLLSAVYFRVTIQILIPYQVLPQNLLCTCIASYILYTGKQNFVEKPLPKHFPGVFILIWIL
jgi:hypothetical protein